MSQGKIINKKNRGFVVYPLLVASILFLFNFSYPAYAATCSPVGASSIIFDNATYFTDHAMYVTVQCANHDNPTIPVTITNSNGGSLSLSFSNVAGTNNYVLPTGWIYFQTGSNDQNKPYLQISSYTAPTAADNPTVTVGGVSNSPSGSNGIVFVTQDYGSIPAYNSNKQPNTSIVLNNAVQSGQDSSCVTTRTDGLCSESSTKPIWIIGSGTPASPALNYILINYTNSTGNYKASWRYFCGSVTSPDSSKPLGMPTNPDPVCPVISPASKDVYLEIDYMPGHKPSADAITYVKNQYSNNGINLHVQVDEKINYHHDSIADLSAGGYVSTNSFDKLKRYYFGTNDERNPPAQSPTGTITGPNYSCVSNTGSSITGTQCTAAVLTAKRQIFHYLLIDHKQNDGGSGFAEISGNDLMISLGKFAGGNGSSDDLKGALMHELGHNLGLNHGGGNGDTLNCKPNYFSVMNWAREFNQYFSPAGATRQAIYSGWDATNGASSLTETNLPPDAANPGMSMPNPPGNEPYLYGDPSGKSHIGFANAAGPDWDNSLSTSPDSVAIHYIPSAGCTDSTKQTLNSYNDWTSMTLNMWATGYGSQMGDGAPYNGP